MDSLGFPSLERAGPPTGSPRRHDDPTASPYVIGQSGRRSLSEALGEVNLHPPFTQNEQSAPGILGADRALTPSMSFHLVELDLAPSRPFRPIKTLGPLRAFGSLRAFHPVRPVRPIHLSHSCVVPSLTAMFARHMIGSIETTELAARIGPPVLTPVGRSLLAAIRSPVHPSVFTAVFLTVIAKLRYDNLVSALPSGAVSSAPPAVRRTRTAVERASAAVQRAWAASQRVRSTIVNARHRLLTHAPHRGRR